jgi:murein DD-endopeptidase MepM/ murein hydrolase activator NlpD
MKTMFLLLLVLIGLFSMPAHAAAQESSPLVESIPGVTIHVVQRGENLYRIALRYRRTIDEIARMNGITNPGNILVGQRLLVPTGDGAELMVSTHTVQPGETLQSISTLYGMGSEVLAALNPSIDPNALAVGQVLNVNRSISGAEVSTPTAQPTDVAMVPAERPVSLIHQVVRGETLFRIATQYGVTVNEVAQANNIADPTLIYAGQQLVIPGVEPPQYSAMLPAPVMALDVTPLILVEGQTGRFRLTTQVPAVITGTFLDRPLMSVPTPSQQMSILVGIPVGTTPGIYPLNLSVDTGTTTQFSVNVQVVTGNYYRENINLLDDRTGLLDPNVEDAEMNVMRSVMSAYNTERYFEGPMGLPAAATLSSTFGNLRSYNGGAYERIHTGTDFAGAPGAPIMAPAAGRVVMADTLNVRGIATVIDHGWGVYTGYWHQTERYVQAGDFVSAGQVIGTVGSTGRVTGAHLHWELWVNGVAVDPMQWVRQPFS